MKKILLIGAGGHCQSCIELIEGNKNFQIIGLIDKNKSIKINKYQVIGDDTSLDELSKIYKFALVTLGQYKNLNLREKIYNKLKILNFKLPVIISKKSVVSKNSKVKDGSVIMPNSTISTGVTIGYNCIINTGTIVEHNSLINNNCNLSPGVIVNGNVEIGKNSFIGSGSVIKEGTTIGENCFVRMGTILKKDLKSNSKI